MGGTIEIEFYKHGMSYKEGIQREKMAGIAALDTLAERIYLSTGRMSREDTASKKIVFQNILEEVIDSLVNLSPEKSEELFQRAEETYVQNRMKSAIRSG